MKCKAFIPIPRTRKLEEQGFLIDCLQLILEVLAFMCWKLWVHSSSMCNLDTGKIRIKNFMTYYLWKMNRRESKRADFLSLKIYEALLESGIYREVGAAKILYDYVLGRYYKLVQLPEVWVRISTNPKLQEYLFVKIKFSPNEIAKLNNDRFLLQLNQVLAIHNSGFIASVPELDEDGCLEYKLKSSNYDPRLYIKSSKDIPRLNCSLSIQLDKDHVWNLQHQFSGVIAGSSGTGKTSLLFYILCAVGNEQEKKEYDQQIRLFIIDGKNDQLASIAANFLPHKQWAAGSDGKNVIHDLVDIMHARYNHLRNKRKTEPETIFKGVANEKSLPPILLILDEGASVVASLSKKDREQYFDDLQQIAQMGRAANITILVAFQQPNANSLPTPIRDQLTGFKVILGSPSQISSQTKQMVFGTGVDLPPSPYKGPGTGYIWLEGNNQPEAFEAPLLPNNSLELYRLCAAALKDQKHLKLQ